MAFKIKKLFVKIIKIDSNDLAELPLGVIPGGNI